MSELIDEISSVARDHSLVVRLLPIAERDRLREQVLSIYGGGRDPMWDGMSGCGAMQDTDAWQWIERFVGPKPCILLFDVSEEVEMFYVPSGEALTSLLANSYGFEFYVTDMNATYLICFNHHDMLVCCGSARKWLKELKAP